MSVLSELYAAVFRRVRGFGFGLGLFNRFHRAVWEGWLQPDSVVVGGIRLHLQRHDDAISDCLRMGHDYEAPETRVFHEHLRPGMTVFDLGANIGYYAALASRLVGPTGRVCAFEPDPANLALLHRNLAANGCANVSVFPYAVAERLGYAELFMDASSPAAHSIALPPPSASASRRVVTVPLDGLFPPEVCPDLVKMDIEGAELAALRGMPRMLADRRLKVVVLECLPSILARMGIARSELAAPLEAAGFLTSALDDNNMLALRR